MVKPIDSDALDRVDKALGLPLGGSQVTELTDGTVEQVLDVGALIRRGRTLAGSQGIFRLMLRNVHAAGGNLEVSMNPYDAGGAAVAPYPTTVPEGFDLWILGTSCMRFGAGAGALNHAVLTLNNVAIGAGVDDSGTPVTDNQPFVLAQWEIFETGLSSAGLRYGVMTNESGLPWQHLGIRFPRLGVTPALPVWIAFISDVSALVTVDCCVLVGMFPVGMGQDALS